MDPMEISNLLHIHEKASAHGAALEHIRNAAWAALKKLNEDHAPKKDEPEAAAEPVEADPPAPSADVAHPVDPSEALPEEDPQ